MRNFVLDKEISRIILSYIRRNFCNIKRNLYFKTTRGSILERPSPINDSAELFYIGVTKFCKAFGCNFTSSS